MVDLLGRAGRVNEAESFINNMNVELDMVIWEAFLAACRVHRNTKLGQKVAKKLSDRKTKIGCLFIVIKYICFTRLIGQSREGKKIDVR